MRLVRPLLQWSDAPAAHIEGPISATFAPSDVTSEPQPLRGLAVTLGAQVHRQLQRLRPPEYLALEAVSSSAMLQALKVLANAGPVRSPPRFVPLTFEEPPPAPTESTLGLGRGIRGRAIRGIRFFVTATSAVPGGGPPVAPQVTLRAAAQTSPWALAQAISSERRFHRAEVPVVVEAACSRRHALVLCLALAQAQQLALKQCNPEHLLSCSARVARRDGKPTMPAIGAATMDGRGGDGIKPVPRTPRVLRISVWTADVVT